MMQRTTMFKVEIYNCYKQCFFCRYFLQVPSQKELAEVINDLISDAEATGTNDPLESERKAEEIKRLHLFAEVASHAPDLVEPLSDSTKVDVVIAGTKVGHIKVEALLGYARDYDRVLQELVA